MSYQGPKANSDYAHQSSKRQKITFSHIDKSVIYMRWKSQEAGEILKKLLSLCIAEDITALKAQLPAFEDFIALHQKSLLQKNEAGFSFLDLACTLPSIYIKDSTFSKNIAERIFSTLLKEIEKNYTSSQICDFFEQDHSGIILLFHILYSKSEIVVKDFLSFSAKHKLEAIMFHKRSIEHPLLSMLLIMSLRTRRLQIIQQIVKLLKEHAPRNVLPQNLQARADDGFMVLQEALILKNEEPIDLIISLLNEVNDREILRNNLSNVTSAQGHSLHYAISSGSLRNVDLIIKLCEENLKNEHWRRLLSSPIRENNYLVKATNSGQSAMVESVIAAFKRAFKGEGVRVMRKLLEHDAKYLQYRPTVAAWQNLALFLPFMDMNEFKDSLFNANIPLYLTDARKANNEAKFNDAYEALSHIIPKRVNQLGHLNEFGWSSLNYIFFNIYKDQKDGELAKKYAGLLFDLFFTHLQKLPVPVIKKVLGNRTGKGVMLFQEILKYDFGEVFDKLFQFLSQEEYKELISPQLENCNEEGMGIFQTAIHSNVESNVDKIIAVLSKPQYEESRSLNLINRNHQGDMVLMVTRLRSPAIRQKVIAFLSLPENRQALITNLENLDRQGLNIFQLAVNLGDSVDWIFDLMCLAYGDEAKTIIGKMIDNKSFRKDATALYEFYHDYIFPQKELISQSDFPPSVNQPTGEKPADSPNLPTDIEPQSDLGEADTVNPILLDTMSLAGESLSDCLKADDKEEPSAPTCLEVVPDNTSITYDDESEAEEVMPPLKYVPPCGGIHAKYLGGRLPKLPEPLPDEDAEEDSDDEQETKTEYLHTVELKELKSLLQKKVPVRTSYLLTSSCIKAHLFTTNGAPKTNDQVTFVIAGRKELAMVPELKEGRCILVLTDEEYKSLESKIPAEYDVLALESLKSETHGTYEKIGLPTCRRLAAFFLAHYFGIEAFLMLDDNIKKLKFNARHGNWQNLFRFIKNQMDENLCVSVQTDSFWEVREGELGSKMFMINMAALKKHLLLSKHLFTLFPQATNADYWGEDYHFQLGLHLKMRDKCQGYQILDRGLVSLVRSAKNRNIFAKSGIVAKPFDALASECMQKLPAVLQDEVKKIQALLNDIIDKNIRRYQSKKKTIQRADLQLKHAFANRVEAEGELNPVDSEEDFVERYQSFIKSTHFKETVFRHYQRDAIKAIAESDTMEKRLLLPTGSGKTYTQCELVRLAFHCAKEAEHIVIVTPYIDLVNQFYKDFLDFNQKETATNRVLRIPPEAIVKVCSHQQSSQLKTLLMNKKIQKQKSVLIFCADSFNKFLEEVEFALPHIPLIMLDEYHYYQTLVEKLTEEVAEGEPLLIGSTATPPENDLLTETAFEYPRALGVRERYLAPVIADPLGADYSKESVFQLIHCLPLLLSTLYHPGFEQTVTLAQTKGVIYLPSINDCKKAERILRNANLNCYSIHSKNKEHKAELQQFLNNDQPGILLAVRMLRIGFNAKDLAWAIIAQNGEAESYENCSNMEQMVGRVMRYLGTKIGYVLCFDNVYQEIIRRLLSQQPLTLPVSCDYLAQAKAYKVINHQWRAIDIPDASLEGDRLKSGIQYPFSIIPKTIRNFSIAPSPTPADVRDDSQVLTCEVLNSIEFGVKDDALFSLWNRQNRGKSKVAKAIAESTGSLYDWAMEVDNPHQADVVRNGPLNK